MLEVFYPNQTAVSSYEIFYERLAERGVRGILFDIDNTLVPHGAAAPPEAVALFGRLHALGLATFLSSNNQEPRVGPFAKAVNSPFLCNAHKPAAAGYREACQIMGVRPEEAVFVGDQLFTDIFGANRAGIRSILVQPIHPKEEIQIILKRRLERPILYFYRKGGWKRKKHIF
ncbi:MAG: YqeG family HAD IIIA-type phosphatase [Lachnospiraceae bacterium]|nr:YqeG family HAD IIIA-type phosphatase [Lachnospiraceae bacterium]